MGCPLSKLRFECPRPNPRIFQVWNIDSEGRNVKPGKIEVTEAQLILYQKGDITVRWPLRSLRRYGFDAELFSFECGRRCPTGPGVYAFRCQRAEALFNILQECIQNSGGGPGNISISAIDDQMNLGTNAAAAVRSTPPSSNFVNGGAGSDRRVSGVDSAGYLEPISGGGSLPVQCPQTLNSNSQTSPSAVCTTPNSTPGGIVCIHPAVGSNGSASVVWSARVPPSRPTSRSSASATRTNHNYANGVAEHGIPTKVYPLCVVHQYVNSSDFDHCSGCFSSRGCCDRGGNTYVNSAVQTLPQQPPPPVPVHHGGFHRADNSVDINTNYAKLDDLLKQEQSAKRHKEEEEEEEEEEEHCYVNVKPAQQSQKTPGSATINKCLPDRSIPSDHQSQRPSTSSTDSVRPKTRNSRLYVNLKSSPVKTSAADISEPQDDSPKMHYAVLDLDQNSETQSGAGGTSATRSQTPASQTKGRHSLPSSLPRTREGYAQIDFDRTVALSNSANPCPLNDESVRKTRHNATKPCSTTSS